MRLVTGIVRPHKVEAVLEALADLSLEEIATSEVRGYGRQKGRGEAAPGREYLPSFLPKARVEFLVEDERLEEALTALRTAAGTGRVGDGKILVMEVEG